MEFDSNKIIIAVLSALVVGFIAWSANSVEDFNAGHAIVKTRQEFLIQSMSKNEMLIDKLDNRLDAIESKILNLEHSMRSMELHKDGKNPVVSVPSHAPVFERQH